MVCSHSPCRVQTLINYISTQGSCLESAISAGSPTLTRLLLDAGANINFSRPMKDFNDGDLGLGGALSAAISHPQEDLLTELIERGADVNFPGGSYYGQSGCRHTASRHLPCPVPRWHTNFADKRWWPAS